MTYDRYVISDLFPVAILDQDTGDDYPIADEGIFETVCKLLNEKENENKKLEEALKNSYINEICENCKSGNYFKTFSGEYFEYDFECTKKHFGNEHWKCDGLKECSDFELDLKERCTE